MRRQPQSCGLLSLAEEFIDCKSELISRDGVPDQRLAYGSNISQLFESDHAFVLSCKSSERNQRKSIQRLGSVSDLGSRTKAMFCRQVPVLSEARRTANISGLIGYMVPEVASFDEELVVLSWKHSFSQLCSIPLKATDRYRFLHAVNRPDYGRGYTFFEEENEKQRFTLKYITCACKTFCIGNNRMCLHGQQTLAAMWCPPRHYSTSMSMPHRAPV